MINGNEIVNLMICDLKMKNNYIYTTYSGLIFYHTIFTLYTKNIKYIYTVIAIDMNNLIMNEVKNVHYYEI